MTAATTGAPPRRGGVVRRLAAWIVRLVYRQVDVHVAAAGSDGAGPVLLVANHFGGLADALLILYVWERRPRIVARDRIWRNPVVGWCMDRIGAIPVHRAVDGGATGNDAMFASAYAALRAGEVVLIFPEGVTRNEPSIAELKTGAARIALGARAAGVEGIRIVPIGIHYEDKAAFRSSVFVNVGEPIDLDERAAEIVEPGASGGADDRVTVDRLTAGIEQLLRATAPDFVDWREARALTLSAEVLLREVGADPLAPVPQGLQDRLAARLGRRPEPARSTVVGAAEAYRDTLRSFRLTDAALAGAAGAGRLSRHLARDVLIAALLLPYAVVGAIVNLVPWILVRLLRFVRVSPSMMSTLLPVAALLAFGLTWALVAWWATAAWGWEAGVAAALLLPVFGAATVLLSERVAMLRRTIARWRRRAGGGPIEIARIERSEVLAATAAAL